MVYRLSLVLLLLMVRNAVTATISAASTSYVDVSNAIAVATSGDTVLVPAGTSDWAEYPMLLRKGISIIGAGTNATILSNTMPYPQTFGASWSASLRPPFFYVSLTNGHTWRISGFYFNCLSNQGIVFDGQSSSDTNGSACVNPFRVDHCFFRDADQHVIRIAGNYTYGLVDQCTLLDCRYVASIIGHVYSGEYTNGLWTAPYYGLGTTNTKVFERLTIATTKTRNGTGVGAFLMSTADSGHWVFRHNTVSNTFTGTMQDMFDMHGNEDCNGTSRQPIFCEVYGNTFWTATDQYRSAHFRGGTVMMYSNLFYGSGASSKNGIVLEEEETWEDATYLPCYGSALTNYPAFEQVTNSFFWGNLYENTDTIPVSIGTSTEAAIANFFQEGRDYWLHAPTETNVLSDYVPLAFPHPLATAQDGLPPSRKATLRGAVSLGGRGTWR